MTTNPPAAKVTVAVPVYNEAELLRGTLETLRTQTFADIEVLIFDNASSDHTPEVAAEFVRADARFRYFRQTENRGALLNFYDSLLAARGQYFMWRAADDRSAANYIETLAARLDADASKSLAMGKVISADLDGGNERVTPAPSSTTGAAPFGAIAALRASHASWIYGLFRREELTARMNIVMAEYAHPWGFDHLVLLPFILDGTVAGSEETIFRQVIKRRKSAPGEKRVRTKPDLGLMISLREKFLARARADMAERFPPGFSRAVLATYMWAYAGKRVYKYRKVAQRKLTGR